MRTSGRITKTKAKANTTALACCAALTALSSSDGGVLAFAPPASTSVATSAVSSTGIRKRPSQSAGSTSSRSPTQLRMTDLLLSDPTAVDGLEALAAAATSASARGVLSSFLGDSTFVGLPAFLSTKSHQPQIQSLYLDSLPTDLLSTATRTLTSTATSTLLDFSDTIVDDPQVESELLTDVAHVALDLITFASPTRALLRLSLCVGRLLAIAADWVPDHYLHPEELVFQLFMLCVSFGLLFKTAWPVLPALLHQSTNRYGEKRAYGSLFKRHGGLSWVQTKMILAGGGAEWFELEGGEVVVMSTEMTMTMEEEEGQDSKYDKDSNIVLEGSDGYLYWLQKGEAELLICSGDTCLSKERAVATVPSSSSSDANIASVDEVAILGELEFARRMQDQSKAKAKAKQTAKNKKADKKTKESAVAPAISAEMASVANANANANVNPKESSSSTTNDISQATTTKIRAGPAGATLLRLDASRLLRLMDDDEALADGIRSIVFAGMQDKLRRVMNQEDNTSKDTTGDAKSKSKKPANAAGKVNDGMQPLYAAYEPYEHDF